MPTNIPSSFIPKQALTKEARPRREPLGLVALLSVVVLAVALLFLGGVYVYRSALRNEIEKPCPSSAPGALGGCGLLASIEVNRRSLERNLIEEIQRLDRQLKRASAVLDGHKTFLPIFQLLEAETLQSIRYSSFSAAGANVTLRGSARNYEGIALQSIVFSENRRIKDFVFSDLNADSVGRVAFNLKLDFDPAILSYAESVTAP